ncbi:ABC transporter ATP-binding protein [Citrobacter sp. JGM124]|uniref:ABC transporter ATP-binding protein n=1 Tax=Citrobacter sp. JGM124 TaxID=2799789 RepID=UPI001BA9B8E9|nr:ABC transporter ATP-binding protein [Citrobacter sp. JGM124]MBS0849183.1 ABC transporter ATP-binding protein [Citrobacter sp. JGM124]
MSVPKLAIQKVSKNFGAMTALAATDLTVARGEFICIVGPSGCGKSTLFNLISGVLSPDSGQILIDGHDVTGKSGHVGYMLQKDLLLPWMTVIDNIVLGARLRGSVSHAQRKEGAVLAERYGLGEFIDHYPASLSGGMRQRVALMRTLAMKPDVMLLDEPFGALDSQTRLSMQQWLLTVWAEQQSTVIFVTHDIDEAIYLADRVVVMSPRPGRVQQILPVDLPRPRLLSSLTSSSFTLLKRQILDLIYNDHAAQESPING